MEEKELEKALIGVGNRALNPPSKVDELLAVLDKAETLLSLVEQSPSQSMLVALKPALNGLTTKKLLGHPDADVRVHVAACISEITRITAPESPYDDNMMKDIFKIIVESFEKLDDLESRSYSKRVSILETAASVRSCVVMLDLECDTLILAMFSHFLRTIRDTHPESVISSMEAILTVVIEESEDISPDLLSSLLLHARNDVKKKDVDQMAKKLAEKVIGNCGSKLKPFLIRAVRALGSPLESYGEIVGSLCRESSDWVNDVVNPEERRKGSEEVDKSSNSCRPDQIRTDDSSSGKKGTERSIDMISNGNKAQDGGPEESACQSQSFPPDKTNSGLGRPYQICAEDSSNEKKGTEISPNIAIDGNEVQESGPTKSVICCQGRPLSNRNRSKETADEPKGFSGSDIICTEGSSIEKKETEKSPNNGNHTLEVGSKESALHLDSLPGKVTGSKKSIDWPSRHVRIDRICVVDSSSQKKESEKSPQVTISGNKAQEIGAEELAHICQDPLPGMKKESKKGTDVLSGVTRADQIFMDDSSSKKKESEKSSQVSISGSKARESGAEEFADGGKKKESKNSIDVTGGPVRADQIFVDDSSSKKEGREQCISGNGTRESGAEELTYRGQGRLPGKKRGSKKSNDVHSGVTRADQTVTDDSSKVTTGGDKAQESGAEELADRGQGHPPGKKRGSKNSIDVLAGPLRADQMLVDDSSSKKEGGEQCISGNEARESGPEELADHGRGRLQGKKNGSKKGIDVLSGVTRADQIVTDDTSSQKKESEKSSQVTISGNKARESGAEELADRGQGCLPGKKGSKKDIDVLGGPIRADQIFVDDSSSKKKGREQLSEIAISGNKTREGGAELADRGQGRLQGKKRRLKKGIDVLTGAVRAYQIFMEESSRQKKDSEKSSEVTINGNKARESGAEQLADRGQDHLPGKKKGSKKGVDVTSGGIRAEQIVTDNSSSQKKESEKSSKVTISGNNTRESGAEELADHGEGGLPGKKKGSRKNSGVLSGTGRADQVCTDDPSSKKKGRGNSSSQKKEKSSEARGTLQANSSCQKKESEKSSKVTISGNNTRESGAEEFADHGEGRLPGKKNGSRKSTDDSSSKKKGRERSSELTISGNTARESGPEELTHRRQGRVLGKKNGSKESIGVPSWLGIADQTSTVDSSSKRKAREKSSEIRAEELAHQRRSRLPGQTNRAKGSTDVPDILGRADQTCTVDSSSKRKEREKSPEVTISGTTARESGTEELAHHRQSRLLRRKNRSKEGIDVPSIERKGREKSSEITADGNEAQDGGSKELARRGRGRPVGKKNSSKESIAGPSGLGRADQIGPDDSSAEEKGREELSDIPINDKKAREDDPKESACRDEGGPSSKLDESKERSREEEEEVAYDESLVGAKIKVWWPDDKTFYRGVIGSYDPSTMKHKVLYVDGDEEDLFLENEFFKFLKDSGLKGDWTPAKRSKVERSPPSASERDQAGRSIRRSTRRKKPRKSSPS